MISDPENLASAAPPEDGSHNGHAECSVEGAEPARESGYNARRQGKIARLPRAQRDIVNLMLDDGASYAAIIEHLAAHGIPGITDSNLSNWKSGGFKDWQREQAYLSKQRAQQDWAIQVVEAGKGSLVHEAASQRAASQLFEVLDEFDPESLKTLLQTAPENYSKVVNSLAKLGDSALKFDRYKAEVKAQKEKIAAELGKAKGKGGLTPESLARMEEALNLL